MAVSLKNRFNPANILLAGLSLFFVWQKWAKYGRIMAVVGN